MISRSKKGRFGHGHCRKKKDVIVYIIGTIGSCTSVGRGSENRDDNITLVSAVSAEWRSYARGDNGMNDNWYVLFVKSGQEAKAADEIKAYFPKEVEPRILFVETFFRKKGIVKKEKTVVFPGYVFVTSSLDNETFILKCRNLVSYSKVLMRILCYGDNWYAALHEEDAKLLNLLWAEQNCLEASRGIMEGDQVKIVEGPFSGKESLIKKINRHKRQAVIEVPFMGGSRSITVGLEVIAKNQTAECRSCSK